MSTGIFWGRKCLNNDLFSHFFFEQGASQIFGDSFIGSVAKHAIYVTGNVFSWNDFSRKLVVCIIFFRVWAEGFWIFVHFIGRFAFSVCIGIFRGKIFFQWKSTLFSDFSTQKMDSEKHFGMLVKTASYASRGTFGATFFQYVLSRITIFRSRTNIFLPPMERFWHGCESGILRDQRTVIEEFCFNLKEPILFDNFRPLAEESKFFGCIFWQEFQKCILFDQIKIGSINIYFLYVFGLWVYSSLDFGKQF